MIEIKYDCNNEESIGIITKKVGDIYYFQEGNQYRNYRKAFIYQVAKNTHNQKMKARRRLIEQYDIKQLKFQEKINDDFKRSVIPPPIPVLNKNPNKYCIYCKKNNNKTSEHVIMNGLIRKRILLKDCVCGSCNKYFQPLEEVLLRSEDSIESAARHDRGNIKSRDDIYVKYKNMKGEVRLVNRKNDEIRDTDNNLIKGEIVYRDFDIDPNDNKLRIYAKNLFNFTAKYIGYDEIMKSERDIVRDYIRFNKNIGVLKKKVITTKNFIFEEDPDPIIRVYS